MDTAQRLALLLFYLVIAGYAVLLLRILVQLLFGAAIERHRRRPLLKRNSATAYALIGSGGKRAWANRWLPRNPEFDQPLQDVNSTGKLAGAGQLVKQAIALVSIVTAFGLASTVAAQPPRDRADTAYLLKQQLLDIESKETRLRIRLEEIGQQLKPESIERELAGIGSTRPEELREHRRKLLTIERNGLQTQLDLLEEERARIEASIAATASVEYVQPSPSPLGGTAPPKPITEMISLRHLGIAKLPTEKLYVAVAMFILVGSGLMLFLIVGTQKVRQWLSTNNGDRGFQTRLITFQIHSTTETSSLKGTRGVES